MAQKDIEWMLPPKLSPSSQTWRLETNTARFGGFVNQRMSKGADRWTCQMIFNNLTGADRRSLLAMLTGAASDGGNILVPYTGAADNTALPELLGETTIFDDATNWTPGTNIEVHEATGGYDVWNPGVAGNKAAVYSDVSLLAGKTYRFTAILKQRQFGNAAVKIGTTPEGEEILAATIAQHDKLFVYDYTPVGNETAYFTLSSTLGSDYVAIFVQYASVVEVFTTFDSTSAGDGDMGTNVIAGLDYAARAGTFLSVNGEFKMLVNDIYPEMSRNDGIDFRAWFTPTARDTIAADTPVIITRPFCTMRLVEDTQGWTETPHILTDGDYSVSSIVVDLEEAF